jgi:PB1 domain
MSASTTSASSNHRLAIKLFVDNNQQFRRFDIIDSTSLPQFKQLVLEMLGLKDTEDVVHLFRMQYLDADQDWVVLESDAEWTHAIHQIIEQYSSSVKSPVMRIRVRLYEAETPLAREKRQKAIEEARRAQEERRKRDLAAYQQRMERLRQSQSNNPWAQLFGGFFDDPFADLSDEEQQQQQKPQSAVRSKKMPTKPVAPEAAPTQQAQLAKQEENDKPSSPQQKVRTIPVEEEEEEIGSVAHATQQQVEQPKTPATPLEKLKELGFGNEQLNAHLLSHYNGDVQKAIAALKILKEADAADPSSKQFSSQ